MKSTVTKGFWEERSDKHKSHSENVTIIFVSVKKFFQTLIVEIHKNYLYLSNIITNSKLSLFVSSL